MKGLVYLSIGVVSIVLISCNHDEMEKQKNELSTLKKEDSIRVRQIESKDSSLSSFIKTMNRIEVNLDSIKQRGHLLSATGNESQRDTASIMADLHALSDLIVQNSIDMAALEKKLRRSNQKNSDMEAMITRLNKEIAEKDQEIAVLQKNLAETNTALQVQIKKFNDTIQMAMSQRVQIITMTTEMHTVYYTFGKAKELRDKGVISKQGGFVGIGKTAVLNSSADNSKFTTADLTKLETISLNAKLDKIVTSHPAGSYKINTGDKSDEILITDQQLFWSQSKYFVAIIK